MAMERGLGAAVSRLLPQASRTSFLAGMCDRDFYQVLQVLGPRLNRAPTLDDMPMDLATNGHLSFEHLAGLFSSNSLNNGVISLSFRQAAYLYGLVRQLRATKVIEVGRYKGGSTLTIAAAMAPDGRLWSLDIGEKEHRLRDAATQRPYDQQIADALQRYGLHAELLIGDSRTMEVDTGEVDLVFIDGDHSYEGARSDFDRFGRRVRVGGAVLFDDAISEDPTDPNDATVGRVVREALNQGQFELTKTVDSMAHLTRIVASPEGQGSHPNDPLSTQEIHPGGFVL